MSWIQHTPPEGLPLASAQAVLTEEDGRRYQWQAHVSRERVRRKRRQSKK